MRTEPNPEQLDHAIVERQHAVTFGLLPPEVDQLGQLVRLVLGEVVTLGPVVGEAIQLPRFGVVVRALCMFADRLPVAGDESAAAGSSRSIGALFVASAALGSTNTEANELSGDRELFDAPVGVRLA